MTKGPYEAISIKDIDIEFLAERFDYNELRVGFDAAKEEHYGCVMGPHWEEYYIFKFDAREDLDRLNRLLEGLPAEEITGIVEPSGSYHEPLRKSLENGGFEVVKMGARKCTQADELFDDVPSLHDGKSAYLVARLHVLELSEQWRELSERDRKIRAILREMRDADGRRNSLTGRMEGALSKFWPELTQHLDLSSATLQRLIAEYGSAQAVAADPEGARKLMAKASRGKLGAERLHGVVESARRTRGLEPIERERKEMQGLGEQLHAARRKEQQCRRELDEVIDEAEERGLEEAEQDGDEDSDERSSEIGRLRAFGGTKRAGSLVGRMGAPSSVLRAGAGSMSRRSGPSWGRRE